MKKIDKKTILKGLWYYAVIAICAFMRAIATYVFIVPNAFAPGGFGGLSSLIYNFVAEYNLELANGWFDPAITVFVMNAPFIVLSFIKLDRKYAISSCVCILLYTGFMGLFSLVDFPTFKAESIDSSVMILAAIVSGVIGGIALGGMVLLNTGAGGTEYIAKMLYEAKPDLNIQWQLFATDSFVVLLSGILGFVQAKGADANTIFVSVATPVFYSFITLFITSEVADVVTSGFQSSVVFNIITSKKEEVSDAIVNKIRRGATIIQANGVYSGDETNLIVCVVRKKQTATFKKILKEIDPHAFIFITKAKEVNGLFRSGN